MTTVPVVQEPVIVGLPDFSRGPGQAVMVARDEAASAEELKLAQKS